MPHEHPSHPSEHHHPCPGTWANVGPNGSAWPPGFKSALTDPDHKFSVLSYDAKRIMKNEAKAAQREAEAAEWAAQQAANPAHKPKAKRSMVDPYSHTRHSDKKRQRAYEFRPGKVGEKSVAEFVWRDLAARPKGAHLTLKQISRAQGITPEAARLSLRTICYAGCLLCAVWEGEARYMLGPVRPVGA